MTFRAFISIDIEPDEGLRGLLSDLRGSGADLKVVRPELLHLTLKFLGDIDEGDVDAITTGIEQSVSETRTFSLRLTGIGAFPSISNIRVVWVGIQDAKDLTSIAGKLDGLLEKVGFERDRKGFRPHLTIARTRSSRNMRVVQDMIEERAAVAYGDYPVKSVKLKRSVLGPQGPTYHTVREVSLPED